MRRNGGEMRGGFREYDLHAAGMRVDDALAADLLSPESLAFPGLAEIPVAYRRSPNPGVVFIRV